MDNVEKNKIDIQELIKRVEKMKQSGTADLSTEEDLSIAIMNLISLEEHFFFTASKTGKPDYFNLLGRTRAIRKKLLAKLLDKNEGETWCIGKHLLATTMRLMEVGTKLWSDNKRSEAEEIFGQAEEIYALFWAVRLKVVDAAAFKTMAASEQPWTLKDIVNKLVDCCDE
ncbi:MAG: hypothetical protein HY481_00295 [Candidatus Vogelbacteria bacterium]|nr:hypothetical protein [Candidatus Vogelbacteria bacterium]